MLDGVIKYQQSHQTAIALPAQLSAELRAWFQILKQLDLLGQHPDRYLGAAYGNLSIRLSDGSFLITCTQTSGLERLEPAQFARVLDFDPQLNQLSSEGPCRASSEAMTHGMLYRLLPNVNAVVHVHSPLIWKQAEILGLPMTSPEAEYGTPAMAAEVARLLQQADMNASGIFVMGGHEDGVVSYGATLTQASGLMIEALARATSPTA